MKVVILGTSGMLGHTMLRVLHYSKGVTAYGTVRSSQSVESLNPELQEKCIIIKDVTDTANMFAALEKMQPDVIINCIGIVKQKRESNDPIQSIQINALLPHRLDLLCKSINSRLIHISTDCVFSGQKGDYTEQDICDAEDIYGRSKLLGEVASSHAITIRTSIIGHELESRNGLIEWFLSQEGSVKGYERAIFSGLPTCELAEIVRDYILPNPETNGIFHLSAAPISKYELLKLVSNIYQHEVRIQRDDKVIIDRSLDSGKFRGYFGYIAPSWPDLISKMHRFQ